MIMIFTFCTSPTHPKMFLEDWQGLSLRSHWDANHSRDSRGEKTMWTRHQTLGTRVGIWGCIHYMAMDQYLYIPFLGGWTSIYQLFWCSPGVQGFDPSPHEEVNKVNITSLHNPRNKMQAIPMWPSAVWATNAAHSRLNLMCGECLKIAYFHTYRLESLKVVL